ncbi:MAG: alpha-glucosidase [Spirochaetales bacterium]|nr:alpha-glucosidase [Spirochaetales bacterium]
MKIVLIGAGSAQFGLGMMSDIFQSKILAGAEICLMDINPETLERTAKKGRDHVEVKNLPFKISATTDRIEAVKDADFVIISIEVGDRFELWDMDWKDPMQFGIHQVYGENGGAGGLFHALRIIPPILEICGDVVEHSNDPHVFCYSNPMTAISTTVKRKFPDLKFVGMCHEIASLAKNLPAILNTPSENIFYRAAGLNHFSVMVEASYVDSGKSAYADVMANAPTFFENEPGYSEILSYYKKTGIIHHTEGAQDRILLDSGIPVRPWSDRTLFKYIMENFHLFPITVDSHLGEYIPWAYDVADHKGIIDFYNFYKIALAAVDEAEIVDEIRERCVYVMEGITSDSGHEELAVNILNDGYIPGLPEDIAVEVPAIVGADGLTGLQFPDYPRGFAALLRNYCGVYDMTATAVLNKSRDAVIQALLVNPVVHNCQRVPALVDHMIDRQNKWLGYLK